MLKFRMRLTLIFIALIGSSGLIIGVYMSKMITQSNVDALQNSMLREIHIIQATVQWKPTADQVAFYTNEAKKLKKITDARVSIVDIQGKVLGDSDYPLSELANNLNQEEIKQAKMNGYGISQRYSEKAKGKVLFVAAPVKLDTGTTIGYVRLGMSLDAANKSIKHVWSLLIVASIILFVITGIVSYRIALGLTRPLEQITRVAQALTNMNYKSRVRIRSRDEIGQLGRAINTMARSLEMQMQQIRENESRLKSVLDNMISGVLMIDNHGEFVLLNRSAEKILGFTSRELLGVHFKEAKQQVEFTRAIQECFEKREQIRDEVVFYFPKEQVLEMNLIPVTQDDKEAMGVLIVLHDITAIRRLERMRSEFVANVSHELKTPIAAVKGFAETLMAGALNDPATAQSFLQIIFDESERLNRLIGDILDLSKIESKRIPLQFSPVHLQSFVSKTLEMMNTEASKKSIHLEMEVDEQDYIEVDEDRLRQILTNLISNGISYTPEGGKVKITVESILKKDSMEPDDIRIIVADTGIGIPKQDLPRIFERFYRVDKARSRISGGTGLGLSIVKHLVELHKGTIHVESVVGMGTKFIIVLPIVQ